MARRKLIPEDLERHTYHRVLFRKFHHDEYITENAGEVSMGVISSTNINHCHLETKEFGLRIEEIGSTTLVTAIVIKAVENGQQGYFAVDFDNRNVILKTEDEVKSLPNSCYFIPREKNHGVWRIESALHPGYYLKMNSDENLSVEKIPSNSSSEHPDYLFEKFTVSENNSTAIIISGNHDSDSDEENGSHRDYNCTEGLGGDVIDGICNVEKFPH